MFQFRITVSFVREQTGDKKLKELILTCDRAACLLQTFASIQTST